METKTKNNTEWATKEYVDTAVEKLALMVAAGFEETAKNTEDLENRLTGRMDKLEFKIDNLETKLEFKIDLLEQKLIERMDLSMEKLARIVKEAIDEAPINAVVRDLAVRVGTVEKELGLAP
jgi:hypothetical protein